MLCAVLARFVVLNSCCDDTASIVFLPRTFLGELTGSEVSPVLTVTVRGCSPSPLSAVKTVRLGARIGLLVSAVEWLCCISRRVPRGSTEVRILDSKNSNEATFVNGGSCLSKDSTLVIYSH